jgi:exosortase A-associated hydrolase 2
VPKVDAFFRPYKRGKRFCLLSSGEVGSANSGSILYIHPFAEEMNRSRRMAAIQARTLAAAGYSVLQVDLFGCGDSDGEFGDADWSTWVSDVVESANWMRARFGTVPTLWGLRAGCLLAMQAAREMPLPPDLLLWQPIPSGRQYLRQFLRIKLAGQLLVAGDGVRTTTEQLHVQLQQGQALEIGGYEVSPGVALGLDTADCVPGPGSRVALLEVVEGESVALTPAARRLLEVWQTAGADVDARAVAGPPFWQTQEITESPALMEATLEVLQEWRR